MVYVVLSGEKEEVEDEKDKTLVDERRFPVVIEKADVDDKTEWPFPGFSRKLIGLSADDEKTLKHKFAKDYEFEDLQDVKAVYQVKVEEVKARHLPEVDDEFAKSVGDYESAADMRKKVEESLKENFENQNLAEYQEKIVDALVEKAEIKYPPQMVDHEIDHYIDDLHHRLESQGLTLDLYLKSREIEIEALREEIKPNAEERLKRGLILMEVGNQEKIEVTQEEIQEKTQQALKEINQYFPPEEARKLSSGEALQGLVSRIVTDEITQRTLERLRKIAKGEPIEEETKEKEEPTAEEANDKAAKKETRAEEPHVEEMPQPEAEQEAEEASAE